MNKITDAQVEVAANAYSAVFMTWFYPDDREAQIVAMRAALEAYERVRDFAAIYRNAVAETEQQEKQP